MVPTEQTGNLNTLFIQKTKEIFLQYPMEHYKIENLKFLFNLLPHK